MFLHRIFFFWSAKPIGIEGGLAALCLSVSAAVAGMSTDLCGFEFGRLWGDGGAELGLSVPGKAPSLIMPRFP